MQVLSNTRRLARVLKNPPILLNSAANHKLLLSSSSDTIGVIQFSISPQQWQPHSNSSSTSGQSSHILMPQHPVLSRTTKSSFCTSVDTAPTEAVKELYDKILDSINVKKTMSPNAWLWSLIENCKNYEDIKLLFDALQNLRRFRIVNLRIYDNFNCHLCREITKACTRVGAIDFGKKALWKHNLHGMTPNIGSANHLLSYAKENNDVSLMVEVMKLFKKNEIQVQPSTVDTVLSICYNAGNWELMSKYAKNVLRAGIKFHKTAFDMWMDLAIRRGDTESLWKIEKVRSESMQHHTPVSGFSCAKGLILEHKPEDAAVVIQVLNQTLPDNKKPGIVIELKKLVGEWPSDVVKHQPEENRKAVADALKVGIPAMLTSLSKMGLNANINLEHLNLQEEISS